jgi:nucleotide-binding universal stress UspA family protein
LMFFTLYFRIFNSKPMKTILVLTDFSISADNTAHYALKFAQQIEADLLLCNIYMAPDEELKAGRKPRVLGRHEEESNEDLGALMAELKTQIDAGEKTDYRPEINQCSQEGLIKDTINELVATHHVFMAIISMHSSRSFTSFFSPNHAWDIIEQADFPLLVIPYQVRFKNYKTIAFATDLTITDKYVLTSLTGLAKYSDADILITHVADNGSTLREEETAIREFFNKDNLKANNPAILYHVIKNSSVSTALKDIAQDIGIDLLVLIKRRHNAFQKIFERNVIRQLANYPAKPLLIFPDTNVMEALPVF